MKRSVVAIPTGAMRDFLEKDQRMEVHKIAVKSNPSLSERKVLRCVDPNDMSFNKDKVVRSILDAIESLNSELKYCPENELDTLSVMVMHLRSCVDQVKDVHVQDFYNREPVFATEEQWERIQDQVEQKLSGEIEEPTAQIIKIEDLRAQREEANSRRAKIEQIAKTNSNDCA